MTLVEIKSLVKKEGLSRLGSKAELIADLKRLPADKELALRMASIGIFDEDDIGRTLYIPDTAIRRWWSEAGISPTISKYTDSGQFTPEFLDRAKAVVFDLILEGYKNLEISAATDINSVHISKWRKESGIPSPPQASHKQKYFDVELIELAYLNQGSTVKRFSFILGVNESYVLQLFEDLRVHTNGEQDLYSFLEDTTVRQVFNWGNVKEPYEIRLKRLLW